MSATGACEENGQGVVALPPSWTLDISINEQGYHVGIVSKDGKRLCRISIGTIFDTEEAATAALTLKTAEWLKDYSSRPHSGDTQWDDLR